MLDVFKQMSAGVLALLGEDSFLRGTVPCKVNIEHGVQAGGIDGQMVFERSVATISNTVNPKVGDSLTHPDGAYTLDTLLTNNGQNSRFVLVEA